jgi:hypothetical protein
MRIVIPSLGYGDFLAATLPAWQLRFPGATIVVVTATGDDDTADVVRHHGARLCVTDAWFAFGARLNKGWALNVGFGFTGALTPPNRGERCLSVDADVYPFGPFPEELAPRTLYGCPRYLCRTPEELQAHQEGRLKRHQMPVLLARYRGSDAPQGVIGAGRKTLDSAARSCLGYFQLWRHCGFTFSSNMTAGKYDIVFRDQFEKRAALTDFYVLHLGDASRKNWSGRSVPRWGARPTGPAARPVCEEEAR